MPSRSFRNALGVLAFVAVFLLAFAAGASRAQEITGRIIAIAAKDYDPTKSVAGPSLAGLRVGIDQRGIAIGADVRSWWVNIGANVMAYSDYKATFGGSFQAVTFSVYRDAERYIYDVRDGTGAVKNETGEVIAEGRLRTAGNWLAIPGKTGTTFKFEAYGSSVKATWPDTEPGEFAFLSLNQTHDWTISDDRFLFLAEVSQLGRPTLFVRLPESITRASFVTVPKGDLDLFGYRIVAPADGGKVKFQKGAVVDCSGCTSAKL
jgi:hypothetical protein